MEGGYVVTPVCLFVILEDGIFLKLYWLVLRVILFLLVCQSPTYHNFKLIFTKLPHMVKLVKSKKPFVFEVNRSTSAKQSIYSRPGARAVSFTCWANVDCGGSWVSFYVSRENEGNGEDCRRKVTPQRRRKKY